jgi:hypothetical protein
MTAVETFYREFAYMNERPKLGAEIVVRMSFVGSIPPVECDPEVLQAIKCSWPSNDGIERHVDTV